MPITLYKFGPQWGLDDPSPFVVKLECYLRLAGIDYTAPEFSMADMKKAPKGKYHYVLFESGEVMGDSNLIIDRLIREGHLDPDAHLSKEQKAISLAFRRLLDENLYWVGLYSRWKDDQGWPVIKELYFSEVPKFMRDFIANRVQKQVWGNAHGHGMGRHEEEVIYEIGMKDIEALSDHLGKKQFFFGGKRPSMLDVCAYGYIANFIRPPMESPIKSFVLKKTNLVNHAERMHKRLKG